MMSDTYIPKNYSVIARRVERSDDISYYRKLADWCGGTISVQTNPERGLDVHIAIPLLAMKSISINVASIGDWIVNIGPDVFIVLVDESFEASFFQPNMVPKEICPNCLADVANTQMSDERKKCHLCSSGYTGSGRQEEYEILRAFGAVKKVGRGL